MTAADGANRRLFVALPLPGNVLDLAIKTQRVIAQQCRVRLVSRDQLHCTLAFIGRVDQEGVDTARRVSAGVAREWGGWAFVGGVVLLPNARRTRVVALGLEDCEGTLGRLHRALVSELRTKGLIHADERTFRPHVTVARLKEPGPVQPMTECEPIRFGVESVCLYESELRSEGPVYSVLESVDLQMAHEQETA